MVKLRSLDKLLLARLYEWVREALVECDPLGRVQHTDLIYEVPELKNLRAHVREKVKMSLQFCHVKEKEQNLKERCQMIMCHRFSTFLS